MARPKKDIDGEQVRKLAEIHCTNQEIAAIVGCSVDTLMRRFAEEINKGKEQGREKLRRLQWKAAERGNVAMMIWLGKQYLGQSDKLPTEEKAIDDGLKALADAIRESKSQ